MQVQSFCHLFSNFLRNAQTFVITFRPRFQIDAAERILRMIGGDAERYASRFTTRCGPRIQIVLTEDIDWIAAAGDYSELHAHGRSHLLRETMRSLEQKLDPGKFLRIHRSRILSKARIVELRNIENRESLIKLSDGSEHRSSRTYADHIDSWLQSNGEDGPAFDARLMAR
jgi:two-component system, LytTR family, response regulator